MFKFKSLSLTVYAEEMFEMVSKLTNDFVYLQNIDNTDCLNLIDELINFTKYKVINIFNQNNDFKVGFRFNISRIKKIKKISDVNKIKFKNIRKVLFVNQGKEEISKYTKIYGSDTNGLTRILSRVYLKKLMRTPTYLT